MVTEPCIEITASLVVSSTRGSLSGQPVACIVTCAYSTDSSLHNRALRSSMSEEQQQPLSAEEEEELQRLEDEAWVNEQMRLMGYPTQQKTASPDQKASDSKGVSAVSAASAGSEAKQAKKPTDFNAPQIHKPVTALPVRFRDASTRTISLLVALMQVCAAGMHQWQAKPVHPRYRTSSAMHGVRPPASAELPRVYHVRQHKFTDVSHPCSLAAFIPDVRACVCVFVAAKLRGRPCARHGPQHEHLQIARDLQEAPGHRLLSRFLLCVVLHAVHGFVV